MRRHFTYILAVFMAISALFASCAKEGYQGGESSLMQSEIVAALDSDSLAVQQLAVEVASAMGIQDGGVGQPLGDRTVSEVIPIQLNGEAIRTAGYSPEAVPAFFAVNYAPGGYSIVSSAHGESSLWAFFPDGQFSLQKMAECPPLCLLMERAVEMSVEKAGPRYPPAHRIGDEDDTIFEPYVEESRNLEMTNERMEPLLPVVWGQGYPYNAKVAPSPAGCVATAMAQVLAYYRKPAKWDWAKLRKHHPKEHSGVNAPEAYSELADLFQDLGQLVDMKYGASVSNADPKLIPPALVGLGFSSGGILRDLDYARVKGELSAGHPVIAGGFSHHEVRSHGIWPFDWEEDLYSGGHAFVLDGWCVFRRRVDVYRKMGGGKRKKERSFCVYKELVHVNMGWDDPWCNGYFYCGLFDTEHMPYPDRPTRGRRPSYEYLLKALEGVRP